MPKDTLTVASFNLEVLNNRIKHQIMKKAIGFTIALMLLTLSVFGRQSLEGVWVNDQHHKKISIQYVRGDLYIYGVYPSYEDGQRFFRSSRNKFRDRFGNVVKIESDNFLEIRYSENWRKIEFRKVARRSDVRGCSHSSCVGGSRCSHATSNNRYRNSTRPNTRSNRYQDSGRHSGGLRLEGTWYNAELRKDLYVIEDRNGFKITFKSGDWKYFEKVDDYRYKDNKGNTYTINPDGSMTWFSHSGDRRYTLEKTSSTIPW